MYKAVVPATGALSWFLVVLISTTLDSGSDLGGSILSLHRPPHSVAAFSAQFPAPGLASHSLLLTARACEQATQQYKQDGRETRILSSL